jgi:thiol-disulfide isomerase/thioredoxin
LKMRRFILAGLVGALAIAALFVLAVEPRGSPHAGGSGAPEPSDAERALLGDRQWLNTPPLRAEDLRGKVVLVNFWTYSCINSLRALPYVRAWAEKYKDRGLVVIGVHTPEFGFEKVVDNVRRANAALGVGYPVAMDSDYAIWQAYGNEAWPAFYFTDAKGRVRRRVLGEGGYDQSERLIQRLLAEARHAPVDDGIASVVGIGPEAAADLKDLQSEETYVGYAKASNFASTEAIRRDVRRPYTAAPVLRPGQWSLAGPWTMGGEFATLNDAPGAIRFRFHARDLNLVMAPSAAGHPIRFRVTIDGAAPRADHGWDTDAEGRGSIQDPRMYQLVRQNGMVADRMFEIQFLDAGARAYVFTFG